MEHACDALRDPQRLEPRRRCPLLPRRPEASTTPARRLKEALAVRVGDFGGEEAAARSHVQGGIVSEEERVHRADVPGRGRLVQRGPASRRLAIHERGRAFEQAKDSGPVVPFRRVEEGVLLRLVARDWRR